MTLMEGAAILLRAVYMVAFMYGVVLIIESAWRMKSSDATEGMNGIMAILFLTAGPSLIRILFTVFGLPGGFDL